MTFDMLTVFIPLTIAAIIGYIAQWIGLCVVRGTKELLAGKPSFIGAILLCGIWIWISAVSSNFIGHAVPFQSFKMNIWFAVGGFLFGIGSAINQGCGISTLSRLSRGDLQMLATIMGWLIGWVLLAKWPLQSTEFESRVLPGFVLPALILGSMLITGWVIIGDRERHKIWLSIMSIGLLAGFLFSFQPSWSPSSLLQDISLALISQSDASWPEIIRFQIFFALLIGMLISAWRHRRFSISNPGITKFGVHLIAGLLMGVGGAIALGGNDTQLLLALPTLSTSSLITVFAMVVGIITGLKFQAGFNKTENLSNSN